MKYFIISILAFILSVSIFIIYTGRDEAYVIDRCIEYGVDKKYVLYIDYNQPITNKRLYLVNMKTRTVVLTDYVGHSLKSGILYATDFSNIPNTYLSSYGVFESREQYNGSYGNSMRVQGLDKTNNSAMRRAIVFHKMIIIPYSLGCFTTPGSTNDRLIDLINNGTLIIVDYGVN